MKTGGIGNLTGNQIPYGSVGSSPTDRAKSVIGQVWRTTVYCGLRVADRQNDPEVTRHILIYTRVAHARHVAPRCAAPLRRVAAQSTSAPPRGRWRAATLEAHHGSSRPSQLM